MARRHPIVSGVHLRPRCYGRYACEQCYASACSRLGVPPGATCSYKRMGGWPLAPGGLYTTNAWVPLDPPQRRSRLQGKGGTSVPRAIGNPDAGSVPAVDSAPPVRSSWDRSPCTTCCGWGRPCAHCLGGQRPQVPPPTPSGSSRRRAPVAPEVNLEAFSGPRARGLQVLARRCDAVPRPRRSLVPRAAQPHTTLQPVLELSWFPLAPKWSTHGPQRCRGRCKAGA